MKIKSNIMAFSASLLFGVVIFLFWMLLYPAHFNFHEQYQCFLYTQSYFQETISMPGGFIMYVSRFLTQFFYYVWIGALMYAVLLVVLHQLVWRVLFCIKRTSEKPYHWYALSFIPAVMYWVLMCDENYLPAGILGIVIELMVFLGCMRIKCSQIREITIILSIPVLFVLIDGGFWIPTLLLCMMELKKSWKHGFLLLLISGVVAVGTVLVGYNLVQYPMWRLWIGMNHFRYIEGDSLVQLLGWGSLFGLMFFYLLLPKVSKRTKQKWCLFLSSVLVLWGGYYAVSNSYAMKLEEYMAYDKCVRNQDWKSVIKMANEHIPTTPYTVAYLNLALGKAGQLGNRMFQYFQHGESGLMPDFEKHPVRALVSSEIYYHLGFINIGQCHAFEAMESAPDFQKSVRILQRLVETNMINRQYGVARKYAHILQHTQFYRTWANEALACMDDSIRFNRHKDWVYLREVRNIEDFMYSSQEKDMMLGLLYTYNYKNKMAFEYLMAYCLLNKDLQHFTKYFSVGRKLNYREIPRHFQEGLTMYWTQQKGSLQGIPWPINPIVKRSIMDYASIYMQRKGTAQELLGKKYKNTFWYYMSYE